MIRCMEDVVSKFGVKFSMLNDIEQFILLLQTS